MPLRQRQEIQEVLRAIEFDAYIAFKIHDAIAAIHVRCFAGVGALSRKHEELIDVGISVATDCESCMKWHIEQAAACGAMFVELLEAIGSTWR